METRENIDHIVMIYDFLFVVITERFHGKTYS